MKGFLLHYLFCVGIDAANLILGYAGEKSELLAICCNLLMLLSRSDVCKELIVGAKGLGTIVSALKAHPSCQNLQVCIYFI